MLEKIGKALKKNYKYISNINNNNFDISRSSKCIYRNNNFR